MALIVYACLINFNLFISPPDVTLEAAAPLSGLFYGALKAMLLTSGIQLAFIFVVLVLLQALLLSYIVEKNKLFTSSNGLVAFSYVILVGLFNTHIFLAPPFLACFPLLIALDKMLDSYQDNSMGNIFNIGLALGIASLFYLPMFTFAFFLAAGLAILRIFNWREFTIALSGIGIPYIWAATYYYLTGRLGWFFSQHFTNPLPQVVHPPIDYIEINLKISLVLGIIGLTLFFFQRQVMRLIVRLRRIFTAIVYLAVAAIPTFLFTPTLSLAPIAVLLPALALFLAYCFFEIKELIYAELLHLILLSTALAFQYFYL